MESTPYLGEGDFSQHVNKKDHVLKKAHVRKQNGESSGNNRHTVNRSEPLQAILFYVQLPEENQTIFKLRLIHLDSAITY
ncbi:hypothetical protein Xmau_03988 [Xenorhabdus mauleonii]|uniref:Uncharacterized protein n=1 Tax=Xenorhabdus mauleonii TaxID=351675 RepID=A0A1I3TJI7_9GAMM|nr:hypothetical protein Xmau_03988 [Xenorhabdus mauleonii]SFJ71384.1 hypothetical protein SAMN05421680_11472 [Xenorhabdus mauleonii]